MPQDLPALSLERSHWLRFAVGLLLALSLLGYLVADVSPRAVMEAFGRISWVGFVLAALLHGASLALRVGRWQGLLQACGCAPSSGGRWLAWDAAFFGWLVNLVFPARLGELARPLMYGRAAQRPVAKVLGTSVVERVADLTMVGMLGFVALTFLAASGKVASELAALVWASLGVAAVVLVLLLFVGRRGEIETGPSDDLRVGSGKLGKRLGSLLRRFREGVGVLREPRTLVRLALESTLIWGLEAACVAVLLATSGFPVSLGLALAHVVIVTLSVSVVTLPFGLGVEQATTVGLLALWGVALVDALALSFSLSFVALLWVVPGGLYAWWRQWGARAAS